MSAQRVAMRNIKECLRLKFEGGLSHEKIARALQLSKGDVSKYVTAAAETGMEWPALAVLDEVALAAALLPTARVRQSRGERGLPGGRGAGCSRSPLGRASTCATTARTPG